MFAYPSELTRWLNSEAEPINGSWPTAPQLVEVQPAPAPTVLAPPSPTMARRVLARWRVLGAVGGLLAASAGLWTMARPVSARQPVSLSATDAETRDLYLRGRAAWARRTPASLTLATDLFGEAIARDPRLPDAYVGLADAWLLRREFATAPESVAYARADSAAAAALAIDPDLPGAVRAKAFTDFWWRKDHLGGLAGFRRAIALSPSDAQSHHWYATALADADANVDAVREIETARQLDPANPAILADRGLLLYKAGHVGEAVTALDEVIAAYPQQADAHAYLSYARLVLGDTTGFAAEEFKAATLRGDANQIALFNKISRMLARNGRLTGIASLSQRASAGFRDGSLSADAAAKMLAAGVDRVEAAPLPSSAQAQTGSSALTAPNDRQLRALAAR